MFRDGSYHKEGKWGEVCKRSCRVEKCDKMRNASKEIDAGIKNLLKVYANNAVEKLRGEIGHYEKYERKKWSHIAFSQFVRPMI